MPSDQLRTHLASVREKRGYLLPHHGLMAVSMPNLLAAYDSLYTALTLQEGRLTEREREYVWMAILISSDEAIGTHHIRKYHLAGGDNQELSRILALTALAKGAEAYQFVDAHWLPHLPDFNPTSSYLQAFHQAAGDSPVHSAHMATAAIYTCIGNWRALEWQIAAAYADGIDEIALAEALSLTMFPGGVPNFVEAADVWRKLIAEGRVTASADFATWADMSGQGGFDEAIQSGGSDS